MSVPKATPQNPMEMSGATPGQERSMSPLEAALKYNELGWVTIPIHKETKKPLIKWKRYQTEHPQIKTLKKWFTMWPDANIALVCGRISGIFALDFDSPEAVEFYENAYDPDLQQTICQRTGRGLHALYRLGDKDVPLIRGVANKIDLKGEKSYILAEPSVHPNGRLYEWINANPLDGPDSLVDLLDCPLSIWRLIQDYRNFKGLSIDNPYGKKNAEGWEQEALMGVGEGARNDTAAKLAGLYLHKGMTLEQADILLQQWNLKNTPPLPQNEIRECVNSIYKSHEDQKLISKARRKDLEKAREEYKKIIEKANKEYEKILKKASEEHKACYQKKEKEREKIHKNYQTIVEKTYTRKINKIRDIIQGIVILNYPDGEISYEIHFTNKRQVTCKVEDLTSYRLFRNRVIEGTKLILPPLKKREWDEYLQQYLDSAVEKKVDPYETVIGTISETIEEWMKQRDEWQNMKDSDDAKNSQYLNEINALKNCCVIRDGKIYFTLSLLQEALLSKKIGLSRSRLCILLRNSGFIPTKPVKYFDKTTQVRTWEISTSAFKAL